MSIARRIEAALFRRNRSAMLPPSLWQQSSQIPQERALLVVDIDHRDGWTPKLISENEGRKKIAKSLAERIALIRKSGVPVIFVMFDSCEIPKPMRQPQLHEAKYCIGCDREKNRLAEFLNHLHGKTFEPVFVKRAYDAFSNPDLAPYLHFLGTKELLLAGCNTFACIEATAQGAVRHGFNITLIEDSTFPPFVGDCTCNTKTAWIKSVEKHASLYTNPTVAIRSFV